MIKVLILAVILMVIAFAGLSIKLFIDRKAEFRGGSCAASSPELEKQGISCGCGGGCYTAEKEQKLRIHHRNSFPFILPLRSSV